MTELAASPVTARLPRLRGVRVAELVVLLFFSVAMALPIIFLLVGSFNMSPPGQVSVYGLQNWGRAFSDSQTDRKSVV